jgi:hypothetical protein
MIMSINAFDQSPEEKAAFFKRLKALIAACGRKPNKNHVAEILIEACIEEGADTEDRIFGVTKHLGFKHGLVVSILNRINGPDPLQHKWSQDYSGRFKLLTPPLAELPTF